MLKLQKSANVVDFNKHGPEFRKLEILAEHPAKCGEVGRSVHMLTNMLAQVC